MRFDWANMLPAANREDHSRRPAHGYGVHIIHRRAAGRGIRLNGRFVSGLATYGNTLQVFHAFVAQARYMNECADV
jgi:hypothetical protein